MTNMNRQRVIIHHFSCGWLDSSLDLFWFVPQETSQPVDRQLSRNSDMYPVKAKQCNEKVRQGNCDLGKLEWRDGGRTAVFK